MSDTQLIFLDFHQRLLAFIRKRVQPPIEAEDVLQDVFAKIHQKLPTLRDEDKLQAWIFQITRNVIVDHQRQHQKRLLPEDLVNNVNDADDKPPRDFSRCLHPFIQELASPYREALEAVGLHGQKQKDYALQAGLPYSTVKSQVQRGKRQLKQLFEACCLQGVGEESCACS